MADRETGTEVGTQVTENVSVVTSSDVQDIPGLSAHMNGVARQLQQWVNQTREIASTDVGGMMARQEYTDPKDIFGQMRFARTVAGGDDVVGNALELTEGVTFQGVKWTCEDPDVQDIWNQMAGEQNLDELVRKIWREQETQSQVTLAFWWAKGDFKLRSKTDSGNRRKATRTVTYPQKITVLDSAKILPVGNLHFGMERLAWCPSPWEITAYEQHLASGAADAMMDRFYAGWYQPTPLEMAELTSKNNVSGTNGGLAKVMGIGDLKRLILLTDGMVSRHTLPRADFERWAPVRLKSVFPLVDLKRNLMLADRVALIGAANYILLVKKGDKDNPAHQEEVDNLKDNFKLLAKIPVIFSDHRLSIEIITPDQDYTLDTKKYDLLDQRILNRLFNAIPEAKSDSQGSTSNVGRWTSRAFESRRLLIKRYLERELARAVVNHPDNVDVFADLIDPPTLTFFPARITLESDATLGQQIMGMRAQRDLSRETLHEFFGFDQAIEAMRMEFEEKNYDKVFKTAVPFSSPNGQPPAAQGSAGAQGGRPTGGGQPSQSPTKTSRTANGTTKPAEKGAGS